MLFLKSKLIFLSTHLYDKCYCPDIINSSAQLGIRLFLIIAATADILFPTAHPLQTLLYLFILLLDLLQTTILHFNQLFGLVVFWSGFCFFADRVLCFCKSVQFLFLNAFFHSLFLCDRGRKLSFFMYYYKCDMLWNPP